MAAQNGISEQKLRRRRRELRERKHSFIELIMQVNKNLHKAELERKKKAFRTGRLFPADAAGED